MKTLPYACALLALAACSTAADPGAIAASAEVVSTPSDTIEVVARKRPGEGLGVTTPSCDPSCVSCNGPGANQCTACATAQELLDGSCIACSPCPVDAGSSKDAGAETSDAGSDERDAGDRSDTARDEAAAPTVGDDATTTTEPDDAGVTVGEGSDAAPPSSMDSGVAAIHADAAPARGTTPPSEPPKTTVSASGNCSLGLPGGASSTPWSLLGLLSLALLRRRRRRGATPLHPARPP